MFFFIAGVQPKTIALDEQPRMCSSCGLYQARLERTDHYLSIFFIPIIRIKKGSPFLRCERCGSLSHKSGGERARSQEGRPLNKCPHCDRQIETAFHFCPFCGKPL
ncbi:MAG: zinc ribbon domain-containing protein [Deltaproteobacteria bacterium]|nr:zinc ribbon domain-containing protein [Deltaproteobacteria bacterium]